MKTKHDKPAPWQDPGRTPDERANDLLGTLTLEEKVRQLSSFACWVSNQTWEQIFLDERGEFSPPRARRYIGRKGIGQLTCAIHNVHPADGARIANGLQKVAATHTRHGIPLIIHDEALHGLTAWGGTSFPQSIGLAATWNVPLMRRVGNAIGREARTRGIRQVLSPTVNITRDARSGRTEETYGEDPFLAARMAVAYVKGVQAQGVVATLKHFVANFVGPGGRDSGPIGLSERELRETCFPAFEAAVREGGALSVMTAYNAVDGTPCTCHPWLLQDVLRDEWGFKGFVVADYQSVDQVHNCHRVASSFGDGARRSLEAGMDVELPHYVCFKEMFEMAKRGEMDVAAIDTGVRNVLRVKFMLGLFENASVDPAEAKAVSNCAAYRDLALKAAREAIVLLKNRRNMLPLPKRLGSVAVIGPNADEPRLGGYSIAVENRDIVTTLQGLTNRLPKKTEIAFARGCDIKSCDGAGIPEAVEIAGRADVAVVVVGNCTATQGENNDRCNLDLPGRQEELILAVAATGTPVVAVIVTGSSVTMENWIDKVDAVVLAWYPGEQGGNAIADVLLGRYNPAGRLPVTWPRRASQLPLHYNPKSSGRAIDYGDLRGEQARFAFGYGLSYTTFRYRRLTVSPRKIPVGGLVKVAVEVTNTGSRSGDEVIQLYLRDLESTVCRPAMELKGFRRVSLKPGETRAVEFTLGPKHMQMLDADLAPVVEPGDFEVIVGGSSVKGLRRRFTVGAAPRGRTSESAHRQHLGGKPAEEFF